MTILLGIGQRARLSCSEQLMGALPEAGQRVSFHFSKLSTPGPSSCVPHLSQSQACLGLLCHAFPCSETRCNEHNQGKRPMPCPYPSPPRTAAPPAGTAAAASTPRRSSSAALPPPAAPREHSRQAAGVCVHEAISFATSAAACDACFGRRSLSGATRTGALPLIFNEKGHRRGPSTSYTWR